MKYDIFISYKNDGEGNNFAARLKESLDMSGFSVYFNSHEHRSGSFPERLREAIRSCNDFLLILSQGCLDSLTMNNETNWVREEIICANKENKNIIPIFIGNTSCIHSSTSLPEEIDFLKNLEGVALPEQYMEAPFSLLVKLLDSTPGKGDYRRVSNGNPKFNVQSDFIKTLEKAQQGDFSSMYEIGCMYLFGYVNGLDAQGGADYVNAYKWLNKVAESEDALSKQAKTLVGKMHYCGIVPGEKHSFERAYQIRDEINKKESSALFESILFMKLNGIGTKFEYEDILEYISSFSGQMTNNTIVQIADFFINYGRFREAIDLLESIEGHYSTAEYKLGTLFLRGVHCNPPSPDPYRAEHHFSNAADLGNADGMFMVGLINFRGSFGYKKNFIKARKYFHNGAEKGHTDSLYHYSWLCKYGLGGDKDIPEAIKCFERGAQNGHMLCMAELGTLYQEPECRNYQNAFKWAQKAAEMGDAYSLFVLGNFYFWGRGCEANISKALIYYNQALQLGINEAEFMLERIKSIYSI